MKKQKILSVLLLIFISLLFTACRWGVFLKPSSQDIGGGQTITIKAIAGNDNYVKKINKIKRAASQPAKITLSNTGCGSFKYMPPVIGSSYKAVTGNTVNTTTDHLGRIFMQFTGTNVLQTCKVTITVKVKGKEGKSTITVHPPYILGNDYRYQPENPLTVVEDTSLLRATGVRYEMYKIIRVTGNGSHEPQTWICIACPVMGDSTYPGGVSWGRWLTITPSPGVQYHLRRTTPSNCSECSSLIRFKMPGIKIR